MPLFIKGLNADIIQTQITGCMTSFPLGIMADDRVIVYKSSPSGEKGIEIGSHVGVTSYKILNLVNIPVYNDYTYFVINIYNAPSNRANPCGVNIKNMSNNKCFEFISGLSWGGWGKAHPSYFTTNCWAICPLGDGESVDWRIRVPMI